MSRGSPHLGLALAITILIASPQLIAAPDPVVPPGYKLVKVPVGGNTIPILVKQQADVSNAVSSMNSGTFHNPTSTFSARNAMADKKFDSGSSAFANRSANTDGVFATKSYQDPAVRGDNHIDTPTAHLPSASGFEQSAKGFDHSYAVASADKQNLATFAGTSHSSLQNQSATLGGKEIVEKSETSGDANKQYLGPGAQNVPAAYHINDNVVISRMSGLPSRDLSIDEVRDLINHGAKPDTNVQPEAPTKALNDPDYQPQPLRAMPPLSAHQSDEDKDDPVPGPGMIAAPENAEPLPQK